MPAAPGRPRRAVTVRDAIGDLPPIENGADVVEMPFSGAAAFPAAAACRVPSLVSLQWLLGRFHGESLPPPSLPLRTAGLPPVAAAYRRSPPHAGRGGHRGLVPSTDAEARSQVPMFLLQARRRARSSGRCGTGRRRCWTTWLRR